MIITFVSTPGLCFPDRITTGCLEGFTLSSSRRVKITLGTNNAEFEEYLHLQRLETTDERNFGMQEHTTRNAGDAKRGTLNHLRLTVTDIPRAESFYDPILRLMGFELAEKSDGRIAWVMMTATGNLQWTVLSRGHEQVKSKRHDRYSAGLHHVAWNAESREEVDQMYEHLVDAGAEILDPPAEYDYWLTGYYAVFFHDPDGLKLEYVYIPAAGSANFWKQLKSRGINPVKYQGDGSGVRD